MKKLLLLTTCALILGAPAYAQSIPERTGVNSTLGIAPNTDDFVKEVAVSDMFEIESSKLAQEKGNATNKTFASQMVADHTKTTGELKAMVSNGQLKAEIPAAMEDRISRNLINSRG